MAQEGPTILIVDSNPGFATMLKESLEDDTDYQATIALTAAEALEKTSDHAFDLAIVDLGMDATDDLNGEVLVRRLRDAQPSLRLLLIPLEGDALPEKLSDVAIQGTLSKPFFLPDLPDVVDTAFTQPLEEADVDRLGEEGAPEAAEPSQLAEEQDRDAESRVQSGPDLLEPSQELERPEAVVEPEEPQLLQEPDTSEDAEGSEEPRVAQEPETPEVPERPHGPAMAEEAAGLEELELPQELGTGEEHDAGSSVEEAPLTSAPEIGPSDIIDSWPPAAERELGRLARDLNAQTVLVTQSTEVLFAVGRMTRDRLDALAEIIWEEHRLSGQAARALGREAAGFEQSTEGSGYLLHTLSILPGALLSVAVSSDTALGYVRHQAKRTAKSLRELLTES